ncbi:MAG: L,D-transpeptidase family protein, partial [Hyphomicrobiaceae bacterium]
DCRSAGCYAMTDALVEELYALVRDSLGAGQENFHVHAFPFRMTDENFARHRKSKWRGFWIQLKEGYDFFEQTRMVPKVDVCARRYLVNARFRGGITQVSANGACPPYDKITAEQWAAAPQQSVIRRRSTDAQSLRAKSLISRSPGNASGTPFVTGPAGDVFTRPGLGFAQQ